MPKGSDEFVLLTDLPITGLPITVSQARRIRFEKRAPSYRVGGKVAFKVSELRDWIESTRVAPESRGAGNTTSGTSSRSRLSA